MAPIGCRALDLFRAIAVVVTGLLIGNYGSTRGVSPTSVHALSTTWEFLGFVANSFIFLLIGIELDPATLAQNWWPIVVALPRPSLPARARSTGCSPGCAGRARSPGHTTPRVAWGGLRGAVSLALMLSIPFTLPNGHPFPDRNLLKLLAFGVVGVSLILQGLTMRPLIYRLGLAAANDSGNDGRSGTHALACRRRGAPGTLTRTRYGRSRRSAVRAPAQRL